MLSDPVATANRPGAYDGAWNLEPAALNVTVLAFSWNADRFRLIIELAFVVAATVVLWRALRNQRRDAKDILAERRQAATVLKREHGASVECATRITQP